MRHPQARNCSPGAIAVMIAMTPDASSRPSGTPICGEAPKTPRFFLGACSTAMSTAPPHSPPAEMPCRMRSSTSRIGAPTPMTSAVGSTPISAVAAPIRISVHISTRLRPSLSPKWPARKAPSGRNRKLMPTVANPRMTVFVPSAEKNSCPKTRPTAVA